MIYISEEIPIYKLLNVLRNKLRLIKPLGCTKTSDWYVHSGISSFRPYKMEEILFKKIYVNLPHYIRTFEIQRKSQKIQGKLDNMIF